MGKGVNDRQNGFWMYMQYYVRPKLQKELGRRLETADLMRFGLPYWDELSNEEKEGWKEKAKEYNNSEAGRKERLLRRLENHQEKRHSNKLKSRNIMPSSCRYDEVDLYSRIYFNKTDDFEAKRENDRKKFIDHYRWKFSRKGQKSKKDFFYGNEIIFVTARIYEDMSDDLMVPSEISILKFSIKDGIHDQRHYILGFASSGTLIENSRSVAKKNERRTGLMTYFDRMPINVRFDYVQIWDEIRAFTRIDGDGVKLLLLSKDWNAVVGSFAVLFANANEKSFSRIETHFATLEDYFFSLYGTIHDIRVSDDVKSDVAKKMNEPWHSILPFDSITCNFHAGLNCMEKFQGRSCSLFFAYKAVFNFFALCTKYVFQSCDFAGRLVRNEAVLSTVEDNFPEHISQQRPHSQALQHEVASLSLDNLAKQSIQQLPEREILKSNAVGNTALVSNAESIKPGAIASERKPRLICNVPSDENSDSSSMKNLVEIRGNVKSWSQNEVSFPHMDICKIDFSSRSHVSAGFPRVEHSRGIDIVAGQQSFSSFQSTSVSTYDACGKIPLYLKEGSKADLAEINVTNLSSLNYQFSDSGEGFSNVLSNGDITTIPVYSGKGKILADLSLSDKNSYAELFGDTSIPPSLLYGKSVVIPPRTSNCDQNNSFSALSAERMEPFCNNVKSVHELCCSEPVSKGNTCFVSSRSRQVQEVEEDRSIHSSGGRTECSLNLPYLTKTPKWPSHDNVVLERTFNGFGIPYVCPTSYSCITCRPASSFLTGELGINNGNTHDWSEIVENQMLMTSQSLVRHEQEGRRCEALVDKSEHQSSLSLTRLLPVADTLENKSRNQKENITNHFVLKPVICKESEMFGWSENIQNSGSEEMFVRWLNSAYFESEISRCNKGNHSLIS